MAYTLEEAELLRDIPDLTENEVLILLSLPEVIRKEAIQRYREYKAGQKPTKERIRNNAKEKYI